MAETNPQALQEQITQLQQQLEAARAQSGQDLSQPFERSEVHTAIGEQIQQQMPAHQAPAPQSPADASGMTADTPSYQDPALAQQVQALVDVAFSQSIQAAITQAIKSGNPALVDALHDVLADQLHQELLQRQKLQPAA